MSYQSFKVLLLWGIITLLAGALPSYSTDLTKEEEVTFKVHTKLFRRYLDNIKQKLQEPQIPTIFICHVPNNETDNNHSLMLARDLFYSGINENKIYYDSRPGEGLTINQHAARIFNADKVIVVGSHKLKEEYEKKQEGRGNTTQEIENLLTRIAKTDKGVKGIIPIWFEGEDKENFPLEILNLPMQCMGGDYFLAFFNLLNNIYGLSRFDNFILQHIDNFKRQRSIPKDILARYGATLLQYQQELVEKDRAELERIFLPNGSLPWKAVTSEILTNHLPDKPRDFIKSAPQGSKESYLTLLWRELNDTKKETLSKAYIVGMGGTGKSYLALTYAHKALKHKAYNFIYWLNSETKPTLLEEYKALLLNHITRPSKKEVNRLEEYKHLIKKVERMSKGDKEELQLLSEEVKKWVPREGKWLLIYDNVPNPPFLTGKNPQEGGHIIVTSRYSKEWGKKPIKVDVFRPDDSVQYFFKNINDLNPTEEARAEALNLANELGHLPLALSHAVAFINFREKTMSYYLTKFKEQPVNFISSKPSKFYEKEGVSHKYLIAKTFKMVAEELLESPSPQAHQALQLLRYFSYLAPDIILPDVFLSLFASKDDLDEALAELCAFSLIRQNTPFVSIHRLVQLVIQQEQESAHPKELSFSFSEMLSSFDMYRKSLEHDLKQSLNLDELEKFYRLGSALDASLKKLYKHLLQLDKKLDKDQLINLEFGALSLQELLRDLFNFLKEKAFQNSVESSGQVEALQENLLNEELRKYNIKLNVEILKETLMLIPPHLTQEQRIKVIKTLQDIDPSQHTNIIKAAQGLLTSEMGSEERAWVLKALSNCSQFQEIIQSVQDLLGNEMKGKNGALVIEALSSVASSEREKFIEKAKQICSKVSNKEECALFIRILSGMKPSLSQEVRDEYWNSFVENLNQMDTRNRIIFVQIAQAALSPEITLQIRAQAIEALSTNPSQLKLLVNIAYNLLRPEIISKEGFEIFGALNDMDPSHYTGFMKGEKDLLHSSIGVTDFNWIPKEIISHLDPSQINVCIGRSHELLNPAMKSEDQISIIRAQLLLDDSQYKAFLEDVNLLALSEMGPDERASVIMTLISLDSCQRKEVVKYVCSLLECAHSLSTPEIKGSVQANIVLILAKMELEKMLRIYEKTRFFLELAQRNSQSLVSQDKNKWLKPIIIAVLQQKGLDGLMGILQEAFQPTKIVNKGSIKSMEYNPFIYCAP